MSNVENGQKNALNPLKSPFSAYLIQPCGERKRKNEGQSDMGENIGAHRKFPQYLLVKQETSALCHVQKADPTETNVSRVSRVKQNRQFHTVDKGDIL